LFISLRLSDDKYKSPMFCKKGLSAMLIYMEMSLLIKQGRHECDDDDDDDDDGGNRFF
jgi:hypothetical protein